MSTHRNLRGVSVDEYNKSHTHALTVEDLASDLSSKMRSVTVDINSNVHTHKLELKAELDLNKLLTIETSKPFMNEEGKLAITISAKVKPELQELLDALKKLEALS